jgi:hypothetical protein
MKTKKMIYAFLGMIFLTASCSSPKKTEEKIVDEEPPKAAVVEEETKVAVTAMVVSHSVTDFDKWLEGYNASEEMMKASGISNGTVHRHVDDPNMVTVTLFTKNHDSAKKYIQSEELKTAMKEAGVTSDPEISFWENIWAREPNESLQFEQAYMVRHDVADLDIWKKAFADHESIRIANGALALGSWVNADSPSNVGIYIAVTDADKMSTFLQSPELGEKMKESGVVGEPIVNLLNIAQTSN